MHGARRKRGWWDDGMILIADRGSTKTDWCLVEKEGGTARRFTTKGTNPFFQTEEEISEEIAALATRLDGERPEAVHFYGAGCGFPDKIETVTRVLRRQLGTDRVEVSTDMLAAARGLCGHRPGIACILGTGSNSCFYDGEKIAENVSPLGFILGDEGSGAVLGRLLVGSLLKNQMTPGLKEEFLAQTGLTPAEIIDRVYRQPFPNRFLAGLSSFLHRHLDDPGVHSLVLGSFCDFFRRNVMQYKNYREHRVHFTGSVAFHYREVLKEAAQMSGISLGDVLQSPLEGLLRYHTAPRQDF